MAEWYIIWLGSWDTHKTYHIWIWMWLVNHFLTLLSSKPSYKFKVCSSTKIVVELYEEWPICVNVVISITNCKWFRSSSLVIGWCVGRLVIGWCVGRLVIGWYVGMLGVLVVTITKVNILMLSHLIYHLQFFLFEIFTLLGG